MTKVEIAVANAVQKANSAQDFISSLDHFGYFIVPKEITEEMANEMECQSSTETQWSAALAVRPR